MKIEFYKPKDEVIPTSLNLKINDKYQVLYKRVPNEFAYEFEIFGMPQNNKEFPDEIIDNIVKRMISQSYDHGSSWRETSREFIEEFPYYSGVSFYKYKVSFRVRDAG